MLLGAIPRIKRTPGHHDDELRQASNRAQLPKWIEVISPRSGCSGTVPRILASGDGLRPILDAASSGKDFLMLRIALSVSVGALALLVVSFGISETKPRPQPLPPTNLPPGTVQLLEQLTDQLPPPPLRDNSQLKAAKQLPPPPAPIVAPGGPVAAGEKMIVKVYSVPDLVADLHRQPPAAGSSGDDREVAQAIQQMQAYVKAVQVAAQASEAGGAGVPQDSDDVTKKLERLKKAIRVAAPRKSWTEDGGEGEIEVFSENLCLIVRQTPAFHEAISDLLSQLRATRDIQIELSVELLSFNGVPDDVAVGVVNLLNRELSAEELAAFKKIAGKTALSSVIRIANGRTGSAGFGPQLPIQFTALTTADKSLVEFRTEVPSSADDADELAEMFKNSSQVRSVAAGKSIAILIGLANDQTVLLVTPKVIDRSATAAK